MHTVKQEVRSQMIVSSLSDLPERTLV
jgi:hypothetical protein